MSDRSEFVTYDLVAYNVEPKLLVRQYLWLEKMAPEVEEAAGLANLFADLMYKESSVFTEDLITEVKEEIKEAKWNTKS